MIAAILRLIVLEICIVLAFDGLIHQNIRRTLRIRCIADRKYSGIAI
jgi:hypothetical protein